MNYAAFLLLALYTAVTPTLALYSLEHTYDAGNFFDSFIFQDNTDIWSHGYTRYLGRDAAESSGLAKIVNGKVFLGADNTTVVTADNPDKGRRSVRLESNNLFSQGLIIADFDHIPGNACGIWPAFWLSYDSVRYSEIDIIEGISLDTQSVTTMYTAPDICTMTPLTETGTNPRTNCTKDDDGACGVTAPPGSFGDAYNQQGGGVWAVQVYNNGVRAWYFPRNAVPAGVTAANPDPSKWGTPMMDFVADDCDVETAFQRMKIIINITFCGSNAGGTTDEPNIWWNGYTNCGRTTGVSDCSAYVGGNPEVFDQAYFLVNYVKTFSGGP